ncbi:hypothetical protein [Chryseobacterium sp. 18068]|uniref:hypothetical protein n=1 Tax=Chryseobacterium sp. 18068 TaxID=2681414 RepID=UPI001356EB50|nr:hypothetical protein [Chryseobacterium sp. 18068]
MKEKIRNWVEDLNASYQPTEDKSLVKIAELVLILPALGLFYIWEYFNNYKIEYYLYFEFEDSLAVLYQNLMPVIYVGVILSLLLTMLLPYIVKVKYNDCTTDTQITGSQSAVQKKGFPNFLVICVISIALTGFYVLLQAYQFTLVSIVIFLGFAALASYLYLFVHKNIGFGVAILLVFMYAEKRANIDAQFNLTNKPTLNIVLKQHADYPILTEGDKFRYLIYKSSNYYFIKNEQEKRIYVYSISTEEMTSFKTE